MQAPEHDRTDTSEGRAADPGQSRPARELLARETHQLLGHTIAISERGWRQPSRLEGWSRAHLATHLARQADGLSRVAEGAVVGDHREMYPAEHPREADIEAGAGRGSLELHTDLDTSASRLSDRFDQLDAAGAWDSVVLLRGGIEASAGWLPLARLTEVVLHHVDLDVGFELNDIEAESAERVLAWCAFRLRRRSDFPAVRLSSFSGFTATIADPTLASKQAPPVVEGSSNGLLGWLTGRTGAAGVSGANDIVLPPF